MDCSLPGFSVHGISQEYWSGLPFPSPRDLPNQGIEPRSPALAGGFFTIESPEKPISYITGEETGFLGNLRDHLMSQGHQMAVPRQKPKFDSSIHYLMSTYILGRPSLMVQTTKNLPAMLETSV